MARHNSSFPTAFFVRMNDPELELFVYSTATPLNFAYGARLFTFLIRKSIHTPQKVKFCSMGEMTFLVLD